MESKRNLKEKVYCHIGNGGVTFSIEDNGHGPEVVISSSHFGNNTSSQSVAVDHDTLKQIRDMFIKACELEYSNTYPYAAIAAGCPRLAKTGVGSKS